MFRRDQDVAGQRDLQAAAAADAVDRADDGLVQVRQFLDPPEPAGTVVPFVDFVDLGFRNLQIRVGYG